MKKSKQLENWEISLIKRMLANGDFNKQEILAYFSQPIRSINQARISEIAANCDEYQGIRVATNNELLTYLSAWKKVELPDPPEGMVEKQSEIEFPERPELKRRAKNSPQIIDDIIGEFE